MTTISLDGLSSVDNEERALAHITVNYNGNNYAWQIYIPQNCSNLNDFLETSKPFIEFQIDSKEAEWAALEPKTKTLSDPVIGDMVIEIQKDDIVRPDIPDYYALRRKEYPSIGNQLGALFKGPEHPDYIDMQNQILAIKNKYPKPF